MYYVSSEKFGSLGAPPPSLRPWIGSQISYSNIRNFINNNYHIMCNDQNTNKFFGVSRIEPQISYSTIRDFIDDNYHIECNDQGCPMYRVD